MSESWFTVEGATGPLSIERRDGSWYVSSSTTNEDVKCLFTDDVDVDESTNTQQLVVKVSSYKIGVGSSSDTVILSSVTESAESSKSKSEPESTSSPTASSRVTTEETINTSTSQDRRTGDTESGGWNLDSFTGSGEYGTLTATIDSIQWVKKSSSGMPDLKGELTDSSVTGSVPFVVRDGVNHPYLEEGARFRFAGVKDHYYTRNDEVQVVITDYTEFERLANDADSDAASKQNSVSRSSRSSSRSRSNSHTDESLEEIADQKIGDKEFTVTQQDDESMVGSAKKEASRQQRDPAIDPRLHKQNEDTDSEE